MRIHNSIVVEEPLWGKQLMIGLNEWVSKHDVLVQILPYTADIFVFSYPVYLVALYVRGIVHRNSYYKLSALYIAGSSGLAALINMLIQFVGEKSRPEQSIETRETLILEHLPTDPFPSDHAAVSAAVAMSTLLR